MPIARPFAYPSLHAPPPTLSPAETPRVDVGVGLTAPPRAGVCTEMNYSNIAQFATTSKDMVQLCLKDIFLHLGRTVGSGRKVPPPCSVPIFPSLTLTLTSRPPR